MVAAGASSDAGVLIVAPESASAHIRVLYRSKTPFTIPDTTKRRSGMTTLCLRIALEPIPICAHSALTPWARDQSLPSYLKETFNFAR
jgi:hypothetical protein